MSKHDEGRRTFLIGAAAGAITGAALVADSRAQAQSQPANDMPGMPGMAGDHAGGAGHGAFFNDRDTQTITAFTERLMPGAPGMPGATDANVTNYIDLALAGSYSDQQEFYRHGLKQLEAHCQKTYGKDFLALTAAQQDETIGALESGKVAEFEWPTAKAFFNVLRTHTMEGMFADPIYGGNKDFAGWRLVGFPGAQPAFTPADLRSSEAFSGQPMMGLRLQSNRPMQKS